ncbi:MAG TPA: hypothetical protein VNZ53_42900, partial [Steroidobacteraceae bacterium]|nr:hypothetical protein [Steroidobacteraceae bacterium]
RERRESPYARSGKGRQSGNICTVHGLPLSTACIEYRMWGRGVRAHTGEVSTVYLMDVDIEKLVKFLSEKRD